MESNDRLNLTDDSDFEKIIPFEKEPIMFSDKVFKLNRWGMKQERIIILTDVCIYLFRRKLLRRKHPIGDVRAVVKSLTNTSEFVLHIPIEYDQRL